MKKEVLFKKLEEMMIPLELQKEDSELKHSQRTDKWKHCDNIRKNVTDLIGMPAIDKDFNDTDIDNELPFVNNGVQEMTESHALKMMRELNRFVKVKSFNNNRTKQVYSLKRELVSTLFKYTDKIQYECMHYKFENDSEKPSYYAVFGYNEDNGEHIRVHQPLDNVKKLFSIEELEEKKATAEPFADADFVDDFEHTDQETVKYAKELARFYLYTKAVHGRYRNKA